MTTIHLHHDSHFDLVTDDPGKASLGVYEVEGPDGTQRRHKVKIKKPGNVTTVSIPDDYGGTPTELTHLVDALTDRNSDAVTGVSGDDRRLVGRIAALLDAPVVKGEKR